MKDAILSNLNNPAELEKLYRTDKSCFKQEFQSIYPQFHEDRLAQFWNERLTHDTDKIVWGSRKELLLIGLISVAAGILAKFPLLFSISEEFFYPRNVGFIGISFLTMYFLWKNNVSPRKLAAVVGFTVISAIYINLLPDNAVSDTLLLSCIHLPFLLWVLLGSSFAGNSRHSSPIPLSFLRFNGEVAVLTLLMAIAGGLVTAITIGLFGLIGLQIEDFYFEYIVAFTLPSVPIIAAYLTQTNPQLVNKVSPVIARLFSPAVLVMLVTYLGAIIYSGKDPYNDREFLVMFNLLLIGVMGLIFFSIAETTRTGKDSYSIWLLVTLAVVTAVVNGIALSAILFRITEWGITPNRLAVLGGNILILIHLLLVIKALIKAVTKNEGMDVAGNSIVSYIPVYTIWAMTVVFIFPVVFGFK